jgi:ATP-dependent Lon protease
MRRPVCVLVLALVVALTSQVSAQTTPEVLALLPVTDGVLFPGLSEEIQIAAPEHIQLIDEAVRGDSLMGLVTLQPNAQIDAQNHRAIFPIGTLCTIESVARPGDGRLYIKVRALAKIRIKAELPGKTYRQGQVDTIREVVAPADRATVRELRQQVDTLARSIEAIVLEQMSDAERINALAYYMDLDLFERQGLLEQDGVIARARAMVELFTAKVDAKSR